MFIYDEMLFPYNVQTLLDSGILPILLDIMNTAEFKTRKEAVWAVCNAISGGTPEQVRLVQQPNITTCMLLIAIIRYFAK